MQIEISNGTNITIRTFGIDSDDTNIKIHDCTSLDVVINTEDLFESGDEETDSHPTESSTIIFDKKVAKVLRDTFEVKDEDKIDIIVESLRVMIEPPFSISINPLCRTLRLYKKFRNPFKSDIYEVGTQKLVKLILQNSQIDTIYNIEESMSGYVRCILESILGLPYGKNEPERSSEEIKKSLQNQIERILFISYHMGNLPELASEHIPEITVEIVDIFDQLQKYDPEKMVEELARYLDYDTPFDDTDNLERNIYDIASMLLHGINYKMHVDDPLYIRIKCYIRYCLLKHLNIPYNYKVTEEGNIDDESEDDEDTPDEPPQAEIVSTGIMNCVRFKVPKSDVEDDHSEEEPVDVCDDHQNCDILSRFEAFRDRRTEEAYDTFRRDVTRTIEDMFHDRYEGAGVAFFIPMFHKMLDILDILSLNKDFTDNPIFDKYGNSDTIFTTVRSDLLSNYKKVAKDPDTENQTLINETIKLIQSLYPLKLDVRDVVNIHIREMCNYNSVTTRTMLKKLDDSLTQMIRNKAKAQRIRILTNFMGSKPCHGVDEAINDDLVKKAREVDSDTRSEPDPNSTKHFTDGTTILDVLRELYQIVFPFLSKSTIFEVVDSHLYD